MSLQRYEIKTVVSGSPHGELVLLRDVIKLLEELKGSDKACCDDCQPHADRNRHYLTNVIALIKGENNG